MQCAVRIVRKNLYRYISIDIVGVYGLPHCLGEDHTICDYIRRLLNYGAYTSWIQRLLVQVLVSQNRLLVQVLVSQHRLLVQAIVSPNRLLVKAIVSPNRLLVQVLLVKTDYLYKY